MWSLLFLLSLANGQTDFYIASNISSTPNTISAILTYQGTLSPVIISPLNLTIISESTNYVRIRITDLKNSRFEVPDIVLPPSSYSTFSQANYTVNLSTSPFGLSISRKSNNQLIFKIDPSQLFQYQDQDIIMTSSLNYSFNIYGIGERVSNFPLDPGTYTLFARGIPGPFDDGKPPGKNMYSSQPVYVGMDSIGNAHGGFLLNSNAMDVSITANSITFRTIGGILDYFAFIGPKPEDVVKQYHGLVGFPVLVPYWTLGYHQSRWGYHNLSKLEEIVANFNKYQIPLDVLWTDIDYMQDYEDFTLDPIRYNYSEFSGFLDNLHEANRKFVPIIDAAVALYDYPPYNIGLEKNVFITSPHHPGPLIGKVWPGPAVFMDWFNPNTTEYWHDMIASLKQLIEFDGLWLDMNEPQNFCEGECGYPESKFVKDLPFVPGAISLNFQTIDLGATHYGGLMESDLHNLYGFKMAQASSSYLTGVLNTRPFILCRSSFPGHGRFASKWLGDNFSVYDWMRRSIPGVFNFHIFGIPLIGADICGFSLNTTEDLCCRWYQLGTLYPFTRNHNSDKTIPQEPWALGPTLLEVSNKAIRNKYSLINFFYSHMFKLSYEGGTFFKPSFFNFPNDVNLHVTHAEEQFMLGRELLVHPALREAELFVDAYFPPDVWYDWYTGKRIVTPFNRTVRLSAPLTGNVNIHIRGGSIITRNDGYNTAATVYQLRYSNITLVIALDAEGSANGFLVLDDGISLQTIENENFTYVSYSYEEKGNGAVLMLTVMKNGYLKADGEWPNVSGIVVYGCLQAIKSIYNGTQRVDDSSSFDKKLLVASVGLAGIQPDANYSLTVNF